MKSSNIPLLSLTPICLRLHVTESFSRNIKAKQHLHVSLFQIDKNKTRKNDLLYCNGLPGCIFRDGSFHRRLFTGPHTGAVTIKTTGAI